LAAERSRIAWYLRRLRVMSGGELAHRARQQLGIVSMFLQFKLGRGIAALPTEARDYDFCSKKEPCLPRPAFDLDTLNLRVEDLLQGKVPVAGQTWQWRDDGKSWYRAPDTGRTWPAIFFGGIDYREGNLHGDIRQLWEPARLQHLLDLALIAGASPGPRRAEAVAMIEAQLASWTAENPPLQGPHYVSAMECGLRLIAACHALDLVRQDLRRKRPGGRWPASSPATRP
jgi:hypothetical protein